MHEASIRQGAGPAQSLDDGGGKDRAEKQSRVKRTLPPDGGTIAKTKNRLIATGIGYKTSVSSAGRGSVADLAADPRVHSMRDQCVGDHLGQVIADGRNDRHGKAFGKIP